MSTPEPMPLACEDAVLTGSSFAREDFGGSFIVARRSAGLSFDGTHLAPHKAKNCNLIDAAFHDVNLPCAMINNANFTDLTIADANLTAMPLNGFRVTNLFGNWDTK